MSRFDVYTNPDKSERLHTPFVLDLQNSYLATLTTFVAVPLRTESCVPGRLVDLQPGLTVAGQEVVMDTPMMATFPKRGLGLPVANLRAEQGVIQNALDALFGEY
ncbi:MAG TPA: CcdB family protein [Rhodoferax sp.]